MRARHIHVVCMDHGARIIIWEKTDLHRAWPVGGVAETIRPTSSSDPTPGRRYATVLELVPMAMRAKATKHKGPMSSTRHAMASYSRRDSSSPCELVGASSLSVRRFTGTTCLSGCPACVLRVTPRPRPRRGACSTRVKEFRLDTNAPRCTRLRCCLPALASESAIADANGVLQEGRRLDARRIL